MHQHPPSEKLDPYLIQKQEEEKEEKRSNNQAGFEKNLLEPP